MKKLLISLIVTVLLSAVIVSAGIMIPAADKAKESALAVEKSPPGLEKIEFIHYKKDFAKPEVAKAPKPPSCYKFLTPTKVRWQNLVNYVINPTNLQNLPESFVTSAIFNGAEEWDKWTSKELMNNEYTIDYTASYGVQDYKNAISFGNYPTKNVIAVTTVWYNPMTKAIVEFDIMFDTDWVWGDASTDPTKMDLQNIATHELGHGVGLGDVYDSVCSGVTMYGYSWKGDIGKRTLETPDITGLQTLYGV